MEHTRANSLAVRSPARSKVHVVTVCTRPEGCTTALLYSGAILRTDIQLLGWGEQCGGAGWRLKKIVDFCKEVDHTDVVVVVDGFNAVVLQPREVILEKFLEFGGRIVCMGQRAAQPRKLRLARTISSNPAEGAALYTSRARLSVIHAGAFVGYAKDILFLFSDAPPDLSHHVLLEELYRAQPDVLITIDANCSLFHRYRSRSDLLALTYIEAHAQSTHTPPVFDRFSDTPASAPVCTSPPFFRPSPLPKIAMDALTRETPCFLHIPRSSSADTVLHDLGLPRRSSRRGRYGSIGEVLPPCCRSQVRSYKEAVLSRSPHLDRPVSCLFLLFFLSLGILLSIATGEAVRLLFPSFPEEPTDTGIAGFFFWGGDDDKLSQAEISSSVAAGVAAAVTAVTVAVQVALQVCQEYVYSWVFLLAVSAGALAALAMWSRVFWPGGSSLLRGNLGNSFRQVGRSGGGGETFDNVTPSSQCQLYPVATSAYDAHLQHLLDEQGCVRGVDEQLACQEAPIVVSKARTRAPANMRRQSSRRKASTATSESEAGEEVFTALPKSDSSNPNNVERGRLPREDSRGKRPRPTRKRGDESGDVVRRRSPRTKTPSGGARQKVRN
ncbi:transmembrane protein [Cystoisospora suis]|uniref:Transmembrane protein n=1 Tax=Cystoisospora suis TaxID=483139 RepID=A0A2C6KLN7_9APIC|nr:transmembrane protein [Cystoisospora suis]